MILLMTKEGEEPTEAILQSSRWMAFAGKFFISGSFSVSLNSSLLDVTKESLVKSNQLKLFLGRVHLYCRIIPNKRPNSWSRTRVTWWWSWWNHCTIHSNLTGKSSPDDSEIRTGCDCPLSPPPSADVTNNIFRNLQFR